MEVEYSRVNWQQAPSTDTPINAANLNKMDKGIFDAVILANDNKEKIETINVDLRKKANYTDISTPYNFKGSLVYAELPTSGNNINDTYYVTDLRCKYTWNGSAWRQSSLNEGDYEEELAKCINDLSNLNNGYTDIFTDENAISGGFYNVNGVWTENSNVFSTDLIALPAYGDTIKLLTQSEKLAITFWKKDGSYISGDNAKNEEMVKIPNDADYIRCAVYENYQNVSILINYNEDIENQLSSLPGIEHKAEVSNSDYVVVNLFDAEDMAEGYPSKENGEITGALPYRTSNFIAVKANTEYTTTFKNSYIGCYTLKKEFIETLTEHDGTITTPENCAYIRATVGNNSHDYTNYMIVKGTQLPDKYYSYNKGVVNEGNVDMSLYKKTNELVTNFELIGAFSRVGVIGDSLSVGHIYNKSTASASKRNLNYSWVQYISKMTGQDWINYGESGLTSKTWFESKNGYSLLSSDENCQAYIIALGVNDRGDLTVGTSEDINLTDSSNNNDTFYGWYGKIIQELQKKKNDCKIFVFTIPYPYENTSFNEAIRDMANIFDGIYIVDLQANYNNYFTSGIIAKDFIGNHYTAIGYKAIASVNMKAMNDVMENNFEDFQDIAFI